MTVIEQLTRADEFRRLWQALLPTSAAPDISQFVLWAGLHESDLVSRGINRAARKSRKLQDTDNPMSTEDAVRYASSVMKNEFLGNRIFPTGDHNASRDVNSTTTTHRPKEAIA